VLPTFLVIGAMKAGTTALFDYLSAHPDVFMPDIKETGFFVERFNWRKGLDWYESLFDGAAGALARGEASPAYALYPTLPGAPERIAAVVPDVRLVYLVRHPIKRITSQYLHGVVGGRERRSLTRAVLETPEYIDASRYGVQLDRYLRHFDPAQLLVVRSESLRDDRAATVRRVLEFIGVDPDVPLDLDREVYRTSDRLAAAGLHVRASEPVPPPLDRYLRSVLRDDVRACERWLGDDYDGWGLA
jgi:hypothetical protein